jgi:hypothetical protein
LDNEPGASPEDEAVPCPLHKTMSRLRKSTRYMRWMKSLLSQAMKSLKGVQAFFVVTVSAPL